LRPNVARIEEHLRNSLMLATALNPHIGYEKAAAIALAAEREGTSLRDAAVRSGYVTEEEFDDWVKPEAMTGARSGTNDQPAGAASSLGKVK
jgi:fumarate hydratase class II